MNVDELKHLIAEAARITGEEYIYVIGSNALLGTIEEPSDELLTRSREADIIPGSNDPRKADWIDAVLGELSEFDAEFRYLGRLKISINTYEGWFSSGRPTVLAPRFNSACHSNYTEAL